MKKIWLFLVCAFVFAGGTFAQEKISAEQENISPGELSPQASISFDLEGIEISASDYDAVQGQGPRNAWADGDRGYYRPGTEVYDPVPSELLKPNAKRTMNAVVDTVEFVVNGGITLTNTVQTVVFRGVRRLITDW